MNYKELDNQELIDELIYATGDMEDLLLVRGSRDGIMVNTDKYAVLYQHRREECMKILDEIKARFKEFKV